MAELPKKLTKKTKKRVEEALDEQIKIKTVLRDKEAKRGYLGHARQYNRDIEDLHNSKKTLDEIPEGDVDDV